jgi:hypothetical protein
MEKIDLQPVMATNGLGKEVAKSVPEDRVVQIWSDMSKNIVEGVLDVKMLFKY